jgi:hypothetical protein
MGVDAEKGRLFPGQIFKAEDQRRMFEHVGGVPRMEGVAVTEHVPIIRLPGF